MTQGPEIAAGTRALRERLLYLRDGSAEIGSGSCLDEIASGLGRALVPLLADCAVIHLLDRLFSAEHRGGIGPRAAASASHAVRCAAVVHEAEPGRRTGTVPDGEAAVAVPSNPVLRAMASGQPFLARRIAPELAREIVGEQHAGCREPAGWRALMTIPLVLGGQAIGCVTLLRDLARQPFDDVDVLTTSLLAAQASQSIDRACGYRGEAATAAALQQSMLPAQPPRLAGVEIAHRYLPGSKDTQVGGDWFDAIALPGGRVALVVGDVMGHGIQSAAIMGRLRTSVQTLAALDLPPEQVLRHLDDIARRLDDDHLATCVYAVYDPVARSCVVANAGHIPPVLVRHGGQAELLTNLPAGAPIGVGGVPFEPMEVPTSDGDLIVLCTDGLVEVRGQDIGSGLAALCESAAAPGVTPDELCEILMRTLHTRDREDDVALLIARLHGIPSSDVAQWLLNPQPTTPGVARSMVRRTLRDWGLFPLLRRGRAAGQRAGDERRQVRVQTDRAAADAYRRPAVRGQGR